MNTNKKLNEMTSKPTILTPKTDLKQTLKDLKGQDVNIVTTTQQMTEEGISTGKISPSIKYLSNVKDDKGNISKPFSIEGKKYQVVRGTTPDKKIILGVYCYDDLNEGGENIIYPIDEFEANVARPMLERQKVTFETEEKKTEPAPSSEPQSLGLADFKHFIVDLSTGKFKKFKNVAELAPVSMSETEKYMGLNEFKKYFHERVFGNSRKKAMTETDPIVNGGQDTNTKAEKLIAMIQQKIPANTIQTLKQNKKAQIEVIDAFAEMIGVPKNGLTNLLQSIKAQSTQTSNPQSVVESKIVKKKDITNE